MKPDTINAIGMILMAVFTIAVIVFFRTKPINKISWKVRIPLTIGSGIFTIILFAFTLPNKMCEPIPEPFGQIELAVLCIMCFFIAMDKKIIILGSCVLIFWVGGMLDCQFIELVRYSDEYTTIDADTHKPLAKGCSEVKSAEGIVPESLWHTWFTGIYRITKQGRT